MKVSFIIPVYNLERYIEECVESVVKSWDGEKEILLSIQESEDNSRLICEELQRRYPDVHCIYREGKGASNGRNCGLKVATGEYIVFVDGDDFVKSSALQQRLKLLEKIEVPIDMLVSDYIYVYENENNMESKQVKNTTFLLNDEYAIKSFLQGRGGIANVWRYIYRREFLMENQLWFKENIRCEDLLYTVQAILKAKDIGSYHEPYYCYRKRSDSVSALVDHLYILELLHILRLSMDAIRKSGNSKKGRYLITKLQREYLFNLVHIPDIDRKHRKQIYKIYKRHCGIIKNSRSWTYKVAYVMIKFGLIGFLAQALHFAREVWRRRWRILDIF